MLTRYSLGALLVASASLSCVPAAANYADVLAVGTGHAPPYQYLLNDQVSGRVVDTTQCTFEQMGISAKIAIYPWRRALKLLETSQLDMVFSLNDSLFQNPNTAHSNPLLLEKWYWYQLSDQDITAETTIAVVAGSSESQWVNAQQFQNISPVETLHSAFKMLDAQRVDAVISDSAKADALMALNPSGSNQLDKTFIQFATQSAYFSQQLIEQKPSFISHFNSALTQCEPIGVSWDPKMISALNALNLKLKQLFADPKIHQIIQKNQADKLDPVRIEAIEFQWRQHTQETPVALVSSMLNSATSNYLKQKIPNLSAAITEIIVTDNIGQNLAISHLTTDFYQGDEAPFINAMNDKLNPQHSKIYYDSSTQQFQTQISIAITNNTQDYLGALIIGLNIEKAYAEFSEQSN